MATKNDKVITATVVQEGRYLIATDSNGKNVSTRIPRELRRMAAEKGLVLYYNHDTGEWSHDGTTLNQADVVYNSVKTPHVLEPLTIVEPGDEHSKVVEFIHRSTELKPKNLIISDLKWKYLVRNAMRGKNIMIVGDAGSGKTVTAKELQKSLNRPAFYFNLGGTQDPRATLIGNTHYNPTDGTYFSESLFVKAIQTKNAVILIDETSRAHPEAWNILMTVLDVNQKYLRIDEKDGSPTIMVADGVSFIATANIGNEYTATRVMDRALKDRFIFIEMDELNDVQEFQLLQMYYPQCSKKLLKAIAEIAHQTRVEYKSDSSKLSTKISTRVSIECAGLIYDEFSIPEMAEVAIYPFFSAEGGTDSERTYIKQIVQKYCDNPGVKSKQLFGKEDTIS